MAATEIDDLATALLGRVETSKRASGQPLSPPGTFLLVGLAQSLGAERVVWETRTTGTEDGMVEVVDDRVLVSVRRTRGPSRARFTLAHEIGHLVLAQPDLKLVQMRRRSGLEDAERFCDAFAAALLMPRDWLEREYDRQPESLDTLLACSGKTKTSLSATLWRLRGTLSWSTSLLHWRYSDGAWRMVGLTGVPYRLRRELSTTGETQRLFEELPSGRSTAEIPLEGPVGALKVQGETLVRRRSIIALVDLKDASRELWRRPVRRIAPPYGAPRVVCPSWKYPDAKRS